MLKVDVHYFQLQNRGVEIPGIKSDGRQDFIRWRVIFLGHPSGAYNFEVASIFWKNYRPPIMNY